MLNFTIYSAVVVAKSIYFVEFYTSLINIYYTYLSLVARGEYFFLFSYWIAVGISLLLTQLTAISGN